MNNIITRGLGAGCSLITRGFGLIAGIIKKAVHGGAWYNETWKLYESENLIPTNFIRIGQRRKTIYVSATLQELAVSASVLSQRTSSKKAIVKVG